MAHSTGTIFAPHNGDTLDRVILAPLRAINTFVQTVVTSNRMAKEIDDLLHASDEKLEAMGVKGAATRGDVRPLKPEDTKARESASGRTDPFFWAAQVRQRAVPILV